MRIEGIKKLQNSGVPAECHGALREIPEGYGVGGCPPTPWFLKLFVAIPGRVALELVNDLAVRSQASEGVLAPKGAIVAGLNARIPFGFDVETLPLQIQTAALADPRQSGPFHG
jgi:hypothetical protein